MASSGGWGPEAESRATAMPYPYAHSHGPDPEDGPSTRQCIERGQLGRKRQRFLETGIEHAGAEAHPVGDDRRCRKSSEGAGRRSEMIRNVEGVKARAVDGLGQLNPLGLIDEAALDGDMNHR